MKKLLLLLVGAIVAMTAYAQLYVCGDDSSIGSWNPDDALVVNESNGYYSFKAPQNKEFRVSGFFRWAEGDVKSIEWPV